MGVVIEAELLLREALSETLTVIRKGEHFSLKT